MRSHPLLTSQATRPASAAIGNEGGSNKPLDEELPRHAARSATMRAVGFRGLLWAEWFAHSKLMLLFLGLWLLAVWTLPFFVHPGWILLLGPIYAWIAGPAFGGSDVLDGCEEFAFSLPATRVERYLARMIIGAGSLAMLTGMDLLALGLDLPSVLARLYIDTGLIQARPELKPGLLYGLVAAVPFAVFAFSFALSAIAHSRMLVLTSWFWAMIAALGVLQLGFWYEELMWESLTGFVSFPLLLLGGTAGLAAGCVLYQRKEITPPSMPLSLPVYWWVWVMVFLVGAMLALVLFTSLLRHYPKFFATGA